MALRMPYTVFAEMLLDAVRRAIRSEPCSCIALSGGLDTGLVALAARLEGLRLRAFTAYYSRGVPRDLPYVSWLARSLGIVEHEVLAIDDDYIAYGARRVIDCTGMRDYIELRNDIVFLRVLEAARNTSCDCILLGDGGDELFAGYGFSRLLPARELREAQLRMGILGRYPGLELAECIGVEARAPLLADEVAELALSMPPELLRGWLLEGKWILRYILEAHGLGLVASRAKTPAEQGAGTEILGAGELSSITGLVVEEPEYLA